MAATLMRKTFNWGSLTVLEVSVHYRRDREHGSKHADVVLEE